MKSTLKKLISTLLILVMALSFCLSVGPPIFSSAEVIDKETILETPDSSDEDLFSEELMSTDVDLVPESPNFVDELIESPSGNPSFYLTRSGKFHQWEFDAFFYLPGTPKTLDFGVVSAPTFEASIVFDLNMTLNAGDFYPEGSIVLKFKVMDPDMTNGILNNGPFVTSIQADSNELLFTYTFDSSTGYVTAVNKREVSASTSLFTSSLIIKYDSRKSAAQLDSTCFGAISDITLSTTQDDSTITTEDLTFKTTFAKQTASIRKTSSGTSTSLVFLPSYFTNDMFDDYCLVRYRMPVTKALPQTAWTHELVDMYVLDNIPAGGELLAVWQIPRDSSTIDSIPASYLYKEGSVVDTSEYLVTVTGQELKIEPQPDGNGRKVFRDEEYFYFDVAYEKSSDNVITTNTATLHVLHENCSVPVTYNASNSINLSLYNFKTNGDLYGLRKATITPDSASFAQLEEGFKLSFALIPRRTAGGWPIDMLVTDDLIIYSGENGNIPLESGDYYFSNLVIRNSLIGNASKTIVEYYSEGSWHTLLESTSANQIGGDQAMQVMLEGIKAEKLRARLIESDSEISDYSWINVYITLTKQGVDKLRPYGDGIVYNFASLQIFDPGENTNLLEMDDSHYATGGGSLSDDVQEYDQEVYGHNVYRTNSSFSAYANRFYGGLMTRVGSMSSASMPSWYSTSSGYSSVYKRYLVPVSIYDYQRRYSDICKEYLLYIDLDPNQHLFYTDPEQAVWAVTSTGIQFLSSDKYIYIPNYDDSGRDRIIFDSRNLPNYPDDYYDTFVFQTYIDNYYALAGKSIAINGYALYLEEYDSYDGYNVILDEFDVNGDEKTNQGIYSSTASEAVKATTLSASYGIEKFVAKKPADLSQYFVSGPAATVEYNEEFVYTLEVATALQACKDIFVYDVLPHVGDTVSVFDTDNTARGSQFAPVLTEIDISNVPVPITIYYTENYETDYDTASWQKLTSTTDLSIVKTLKFDFGEYVMPANQMHKIHLVCKASAADATKTAYNSADISCLKALGSVEPIEWTSRRNWWSEKTSVNINSLPFDFKIDKRLANEQESIVMPGSTINYVIRVTNLGSVPLNNVVITDLLGPVTDGTIDLIPVDGYVDIPFTYIVPATAVPGSLKNIAYAAYTPEGEETIVKQADVTVTVGEKPAFEIKKELDAGQDSTVNPGDTVHYIITVTNTGNVALDDIVITDSLGPVTDGSISLAIGEVKTISFEYTVPADTVATLTNVATATYEDIVETDDVSVTVDEKPAFEIKKELDAGQDSTVNPGDTVHYIITVTNTGNVALDDIVITDSLNKNFSKTIDLLIGKSEEVLFTYVVPRSVSGGSTIQNVATGTYIPKQGDPIVREDDVSVQVKQPTGSGNGGSGNTHYPTPTSGPTIEPKPTPSPMPTPGPTIAPTPTPIPIPTLTPPTSYEEKIHEVPETGVDNMMWIILIFALVAGGVAILASIMGKNRNIEMQ